MTAIVVTTVGQHKVSPRIWLEGRKLEREGYSFGQSYRLDTNHPDRLVIVRARSGGRTVSGRRQGDYRKPIMDIANKILNRWFEVGQKLRIVIRRGRITIRPHRVLPRTIEQSAARTRRVMQKIRNGEPLNVHSLFHGGGVLDKAIHSGLARVGINSTVSVAVEESCKYLDVSIDRHPELFNHDTIFIESKIEDLQLSGAPESDVLIAGIPCNAASRAGRTKNKLAYAEEHAGAGVLFLYFLNWVQATQPALILVENVPEYANTAAMAAVRNILQLSGYRLDERIVNGNDFGALEDRSRFCLVALSEGLASDFQLEQVPALYKKPNRLADVLDEIPLNSPQWKTYEYLAKKAERDERAGKGFRRQLFTPEDTRIATITKRYHKGGSTDPFIEHPTIPELSRKVNKYEHARLKGIPESFIDREYISETLAHEVMGQSVTPFAFESVAADLGKTLAGEAMQYGTCRTAA